MKNKIIKIIAGIILGLFPFVLPVIAQATIATPWNATSTDVGSIQPTAINGNIPFIKVPYIIVTSTTATSTYANGINVTKGCIAISGTCIGSGSGAVSSVSNSNGSLTISPTTGNVVGSINLAHTNTFTAPQAITASLNGFLNYNITNNSSGNTATAEYDSENNLLDVFDMGVTGGGYTSTTGLDMPEQAFVQSGSVNGMLITATGGDIQFVTNYGINFNEVPNLIIKDTTGKVGLSTTSPWRTLSVNGSSDLGNNALAGYFTATTSTASQFPYASTTAISATTASTTNLIIGQFGSTQCLQVNATGAVSGTGSSCSSGGGSGTVGSGTTGQFPYYAANGTTLTATSTVFVATNSNVGIASTTPWANLSVTGHGLPGTPEFAVGSSTMASTSLLVNYWGGTSIGTTTTYNGAITPLVLAGNNPAGDVDLLIDNGQCGTLANSNVSFRSQNVATGELLASGPCSSGIDGGAGTMQLINFNNAPIRAYVNGAAPARLNITGTTITTPGTLQVGSVAVPAGNSIWATSGIGLENNNAINSKTTGGATVSMISLDSSNYMDIQSPTISSGVKFLSSVGSNQEGEMTDAGKWSFGATTTNTLFSFNNVANFDSATSTFYSALKVPYLSATSTSIASQITLASTTAISATSVCLTGDVCRTTWPSGSPGGSNSQIQYNNSGAFGGMSNFTNSSGNPNILAAGQLLYNGVNGLYASTTAMIYCIGNASCNISNIPSHTATDITAIGDSVLNSMTSANQDVGIGFLALASCTSCSGSVAIGNRAELSLVSGSSDFGIGVGALQGANGASSNDTVVGSSSLQGNGVINEDTVIGSGSFGSATGGDNVGAGYRVGSGLTTGTNNVLIGKDSGSFPNNMSGMAMTTASNDTFVGFQTGFATSSQITNASSFGYQSTVGASNALVLGGTYSNAVNVGIGTTSPWGILSIATTTNPGMPFITVASSTGGNATTTIYQIDAKGHPIWSGLTPKVSGGTSSMVSPSNDEAGQISVVGTALTSVTMTFAQAWATAPICTESDNVLVTAADITSISATQIVFGFGTGGVSTATIWYQCAGTQ